MTSDPHVGGRGATSPARSPARSVDTSATDDGDPWSGDVALGVQTWVGRRSAAPPDPQHDGPGADPEAVARAILLDALTGAARSRHELAAKLAKKDVPAELADRLLDRFEEVGLIDDEAFARLWVEHRQQGKGLARRALAHELRRKGVDDEIAREVLDDVDPADERAAAGMLVRKKLRSLARFDDSTATRRLVGMLARKGYSPGLAYAVVRDELAASGREAPDADL